MTLMTGANNIPSDDVPHGTRRSTHFRKLLELVPLQGTKKITFFFLNWGDPFKERQPYLCYASLILKLAVENKFKK